MGCRLSINQPYPVAIVILLDTAIVTAYAVEDEHKSPSAPPMPLNMCMSEDNKFPSAPPIPLNMGISEEPMRDSGLKSKEMKRVNMTYQEFIDNKNKLFGKSAFRPLVPPFEKRPPETQLPLRNKYIIYADRVAKNERGPNKLYFEDSYERGLREGIDRCYVALVRDFLKTGKLDKLEILTRELEYTNQRISKQRCNKRRLQIKELLEERLKIVLK